MKLEIDRSKWLRGDSDSALLRTQDRKMCCLGFFALACGLTEDDIENCGEPHQPFEENPRLQVHEVMAKVIEVETEERESNDGSISEVHTYSETNLSSRLMRVNDDIELLETTREQQITELFAMVGVEVSFVG